MSSAGEAAPAAEAVLPGQGPAGMRDERDRSGPCQPDPTRSTRINGRWLAFGAPEPNGPLRLRLGGDGVVIAPNAECVANAPIFYDEVSFVG